MSLFGALNSATAGLRVFQTSVKVVSDNVTQSDDPNRTRHVVESSTDRTGRVVFVNYSRQVDDTLMARVREATSRDGGDAARSAYMTKVGDLLGTAQGEPAIGKLVRQLGNAWRQLETTPESDTAQREVVQVGERFATEIRHLAEGVEKLDAEIRAETQNTVEDLNKKLADISQLNDDIVYVRSKGEPTADLEDRRDGIIRDLAELIDVRTLDRGNGKLGLFTSTGLSLVDADAVKLAYDGHDLTVSGDTRPLLPHLREGKLGALLEMRADGSARNPPLPPSDKPSSEVIRKLRSQLDGLVGAFTGRTQPGQPTSFADAYDGPNAKPGELQVRFFTGTSRLDFAIAHELTDDTAAIKQSAIKGVADAVNAAGRSFKADGLTLSDTTYSGMATGVVGAWTSAAKTVSETARLSAETKNLLAVRHHNEVGVNIDEEMAHLQVLQTSYAATARVVQAINAMFDALERAV